MESPSPLGSAPLETTDTDPAGWVAAPSTCSKSATSTVTWVPVDSTATLSPAWTFRPSSSRALSKKWCVRAPAIHPVSTYEYLEVTGMVLEILSPFTYTFSEPDWPSGTL
ncbi:hypothetical protein GCM10010503_65780 [Streptomyces lucensis JCM 4490]|uniref:Uncharacterized protein n=1 Tax=Streptomyces lucensis JCM 4490 TaxID=1306176 RepID=A0A918JFZ6_9ACTN|nr:hypothetical protein GCM10010503_65780 [Streptomyces lucensis JCM 4490]